MSTTGNEYERPGVNYPDREDADGATDTPEQGDPVRDEETTPPPTLGEPAPGSEPAQAWNEADGQAAPTGGADAQTAPSTETDTPAQAPEGAAESEPSHEAVGIGVIDDGADHHGQDLGRDTLTVSEAQNTKNGLGAEQEQRLPAMAQNNASDVDKVAGIVAQTRQDIGTGSEEEVTHILKQRLEQSGVPLPDSDVAELVKQIRTGDAETPPQS